MLEEQELLDEYDLPDHRLEETYETIWEWWEEKRKPYNLIVGGFGVLCSVTTTGIELLEPLVFIFFCAAAVIYAIIANTAYFGGWLVDTIIFIIVKRGLPILLKKILFYIGVLLSIFPFLLILIRTIFRGSLFNGF